MKNLTIKIAISIATISSMVVAGAINEQFNKSSADYFYYGSGGKKAEFTHTVGAQSTIEPETKVLSLKTDPAEKPGAWQGPNYTSNNICHFGTYAARIKIPDASSQPNVGAVVGFYTYYNDEYNSTEPADINDNGLYDNSEIDFEWLIADPTVIYITAYTDYHGPTGETRKIGRIINLAQGIIYKTEYAETLGGIGTKLTGAENQPETIAALPGYDASKQFYTYGFDWHSNGIRWWMLHPETADTLVLWDYKGPQERITQKKAYLMMNIWHTNSWSVHTKSGTTEAPTEPFGVEFDWTTYTPITTAASKPSFQQGRSIRSSISGDLLSFFGITDKTLCSIRNMRGQTVSVKHLTPQNASAALPVGELPRGIYLWELKSEGNIHSGKFLR